MQEMGGLPEQWHMDEAAVAVRRRMYRGPTPRERARWHWVRLLAQGGTAAGVGRTRARCPNHRPMGPATNGPGPSPRGPQGAGF